MYWLDMTEEEQKEWQNEMNKFHEAKNKEQELANQIQRLVSEYNKFTGENGLNKFIIYSKIEDMYNDLPRRWNMDDETDIDDIVEYVSSNPGWQSSSARC